MGFPGQLCKGKREYSRVSPVDLKKNHPYLCRQKRNTVENDIEPMHTLIQPLKKLFPRRSAVITIEVEAPSSANREPVYITGNHPVLGNWAPGRVALNRDDNGHWSGKFPLPRGYLLEFKITRGDWASEATDQSGRPYRNYTYKVRGDDHIRVVVHGWKDRRRNRGAAGNAPPGAGSGQIIIHPRMTALGLAPRDVIVWLPPGYKRTKKRRYPVLYMHDGQNLFDPATSYTGITWRVGETLSRLIAEKQVKEVIVVGVYNTEQRLEEYSCSDLGTRYRRFVAEQLKEFIDNEYRTLADRRNTAVMGSSMGGLVSFLTAWEHSQTFYQAACLSPTFIYDRSRAIKYLRISPPPAFPIRIYLDCGGRGGEKRLYRGCKRVIRYLRRKGFMEGSGYMFRYFKDHEHSEHAWASRLHISLRFMFGVDEGKG